MASVAERTDTATVLICRLAVSLTIAVWAFMVLLSGAQIAGASGEAKEWAFYLGGFALLLPASLVAGHAVCARLDDVRRLTWAATAGPLALLGVIAVARFVYALDGESTGDSPLFLATLVGYGATVPVLVSSGPPAALNRVGTLPALVVTFSLVVVVAVLAFAPGWVLSLKNLLAATAVAAAATAVYLRLLRRSPSRRAGVAADGLVVVLIALVCNDLGLYDSDNAFRFFDITSNLHQNFFLGPTNDVMHGRPMLVDTFSQYGAGVFYFLAGWFEISTIGYGSMTLLSGLLTAIQVTTGWLIVRLIGGSRLLAAGCATVLVSVLFFAGSLPAPTSHPSVGGLRYLLPYLLLALALASARGGDRSPVLRLAPAAVLGLAAVWSVETFTYCVAAFTGLALWRAGETSRAPRDFAARAARLLVPAAVAVVAAHMLFAATTLVFAGELPDWGGYLDFLGQYDVDGISAQPMQPWSPGIAVCAIYFGSLAALFLIASGSRSFAKRERLPLLAIAGTVPLGLSSFTYYVGNSYPDVALLVGAPAYLTVAFWLTMLERNRSLCPGPVRTAAVIAAFLPAALVGVFAWPQVRDRGPDTPLVTALPGNTGFAERVGRMWRSEPVDDRYDPAQRLMDRYMPGEGPALVVAFPEETTGILVQTERVNYLPVSHFLQESLVLRRSVPRVRRAIARIEPGTMMLAEARAFTDPIVTARVPLLSHTVRELLRRFEPRLVAGDPNGFFVARLVPRTRRG